ncbi:hypothetical protein [Brevibacillus brevis]|uniref:hypothetical protein n=1 Tax=Brevibacillus brevis TaxID=1393 RepID=UPI0019024EF8|nr:hypothetical protein [Brevibacillus brevis]
MKTRVSLSNGKEYIVPYEMETLNKDFLTHKDGTLINGIVYFSGFAINPSHIAALEDVNEEPRKVRDKPLNL